MTAIGLLNPNPVATLVVVLRRDEVVVPLKRLNVSNVLAAAPEIRKFRSHADDEVLSFAFVVILHQFQGCWQHRLVVSKIDGALLEVDIQPVETVDLNQADDFVGQWLLIPFVQLDMSIGTAQRDQYSPSLAVQHAHLTAKLVVGEVIGFKRRNSMAFHESHSHNVVVLGYIHQIQVGKLSTLIAITMTGRPVMPKPHQDFFIGNARHQ
ncbi:hypothetical protein D3C71_1413270 [compost metagenome]